MSTEPKTWRIIDMLKWAESYFGEHGFPHPRRDIEVLLQDLLHCSRVDLYLRFDEPLDRQQLDKLRSWIKRRTKKEPIQYITGKTEFYGLEMEVNDSVLIPRPETERLVDVAIHTLGQNGSSKILDIGTGSGCIAIALAHEMPQAHITAVDIHDAALDLANTNSKRHNVNNIEFRQMDFLKEIPGGNFDMIVCNPPYVPEIEMESLMPDVRDYEPRTALTDGIDGLTFYHRLAQTGPDMLKHRGWMIMEVGLEDHPENAKAIFQNYPYGSLELISDYNGDPRVLKVRLTQDE
ncbi:MAG: peptide chain release factor N(5)-glutamine methyltransferase [Candidatus Marinimicrobia bacterium]|nr:peptide chain release factor N(5)-glutamine methyltransferase [Candidatus Neomarinimicrobiota bacterium]